MKSKIFTLLMVLVALALTFCVFSGCRTPKEQAQRYLRKALEKDPTIISKRTTDTTVIGLAITNDTTTRAATTTPLLSIDCDSLKALLDSERATVSTNGDRTVTLYTDSAKTFEVIKNKRGKLFARLTTPADTIIKEIKIPYKVEIKVPGELITKYEKRPAYTYFWFWFLCGITGLFLYLEISRLFLEKDYVKQVLRKNDKISS